MSTNISQLVKDNLQFLKQLAKTRSLTKRRRLLKKASTDQLLSLTEICFNIVRDKFKLNKRQKSRLLPFANFVRRVSRLKSERGAKRTVIQQGSGLPIGLFPAVLTPIIIELTKTLTTNL